MAYSGTTKPSNFFDTKLYQGDGSNTQSISTLNFQPDWVWIKSRVATHDHYSFQSVFSGGIDKYGLEPSDTSAARTPALGSFDNDGFTFASTDGFYNSNGDNYASWNWKAGTTGSGTTTGAGTGKAYNYSVNTTSGVSLINYTGNGTAGHTVPHHLGKEPHIVFTKKTDGTQQWFCHFHAIGNDSKVMFLDSNSGVSTQANAYNGTSPNSTVITYGSDAATNGNNSTFFAVAFAPIRGFSASGVYFGNNNNNGPFLYTGFKPALIIVKRQNATDSWRMVDNKRDVSNTYTGGSYRWLYPDAGTVEASDNASGFDFLSNGFKVRSTSAGVNANGENFIYMAFAAEPLVANVGVNGIPATAV
tara:strand:+ start:2021 stop:3100 length:1080 start_codon:yes stop_codon:yes gene_type:complete